MKNEVFEGKGKIESKEEGKSQKNEKYWKFKITLKGEETAKTFSLWEYEAGTGISKGDEVGMFWTEKEGKGKRVESKEGEVLFFFVVFIIWPSFFSFFVLLLAVGKRERTNVNINERQRMLDSNRKKKKNNKRREGRTRNTKKRR